MKSRPHASRDQRSGCRRSGARRGFSFTEVLFAVMILGVGFIMVAAIFPVAIQQARTTSEEGNAAAIARGAVTFIEQNCTSADLPAIRASGGLGSPMPVQSFRDPQHVRTSRDIARLNDQPAPWTRDQLWNKVRGNLIVAEDTRYAWVPLYRREMTVSGTGSGATEVPSPYAQVFIIVTQVRNEIPAAAGTPGRGGTSYNAVDLHTSSTAATAMVNLQARPVQVSVAGATQRLTFTASPERNHLAAAEGCYVIIANDNLSGANRGRMNGRIYRIGNRFGDSQTVWELMPGNDFVPEPAKTVTDATGATVTLPAVNALDGADAFIVGRTYAGGTTFLGPAQDIAVYTTFIQVR